MSQKQINIQSGDDALDSNTEQALSAFVDGEAGFFKGLVIRRRLCHCFKSRQYVDRLERAACDFRQHYSQQTEKECSNFVISDKVLDRIDLEERLSLLRSLPSDYLIADSFWGRLFSVDRFVSGSLGAALASLLFFFFIPAFSQPVVQQVADSQPNNSIKNIIMSAEPISYKPEEYSSQLSVINRQSNFYNKYKPIAPQVVDVDWVRSKGRIKVLRNPNGRSSVLWVQKKPVYK